MSVLRQLGRPAMLGIAQALEADRLRPPFTSAALTGRIPKDLVGPLRRELQEMFDDGMGARHIARLLRLLAAEREAGQAIADRIELVWSGVDPPAAQTRDTSIVVQQLFREAKSEVLVCSYAFDKGEKALALFGELAARMDKEPDLRVRLFLNVHRKHGDKTADIILLREFTDSFRVEFWPGERLPQVFYDPRSLAVGGEIRACLHAKCVVIDGERAFISSANFTEAAHDRNIEAGVVIHDALISKSLTGQFDALIELGALRRVPSL